jgi:uncharacterized protein (TIGR03437 family)
MLAILNFNAALDQPVVARTAEGSMSRSFNLPIELSGITMTINGAACGLKSVSRRTIVFVVPQGLAPAAAGTSFPLVINNNGTVMRGNVTIVLSRPDIFNTSGVSAGGRARMFNVTNRVPTGEPFVVHTIQLRGGRRVSSLMRLYLTGVRAIPLPFPTTVRIGSVTIPASAVSAPVQVEPGIYTIEFRLPPELNGAGDQPIVVTVDAPGGVSFVSRLDDTAPRVLIL